MTFATTESASAGEVDTALLPLVLGCCQRSLGVILVNLLHPVRIVLHNPSTDGSIECRAFVWNTKGFPFVVVMFDIGTVFD